MLFIEIESAQRLEHLEMKSSSELFDLWSSHVTWRSNGLVGRSMYDVAHHHPLRLTTGYILIGTALLSFYGLPCSFL